MKMTCLLGASALLLAACSDNRDTGENPPAGDIATDMTDPLPAPPGALMGANDAADYVAKAAAADQFEIESSRALLAKSENSETRQFAEMMVDDHGQSTARIKAAAREADIEPAAPALDASQQRMLDEIEQADAARIDSVYLRHQRAAHDAALALHRSYADAGDAAALKSTAAAIVPVIEKHRARLEEMAAVN